MQAQGRALGRLAVALIALPASIGCAPRSDTDVGMRAAMFTSDATTIEMVTTQVGGKNFFIPSTVAVVGGREHVLSIYNTTDTPHGFRISGLGIEAVLGAQEESRVDLPALEGGRMYRIDCQLHPPHRSATLVVLPGP